MINKHLPLVDPRTYNNPNMDNIKKCINNFYISDKSTFQNHYFSIPSVDKFYSLVSISLTFSDANFGRESFLEDIKQDLLVLKYLSIPIIDTAWVGELSNELKNYKSYWYDLAISKNIEQFEKFALEVC